MAMMVIHLSADSSDLSLTRKDNSLNVAAYPAAKDQLAKDLSLLLNMSFTSLRAVSLNTIITTYANSAASKCLSLLLLPVLTSHIFLAISILVLYIYEFHN